MYGCKMDTLLWQPLMYVLYPFETLMSSRSIVRDPSLAAVQFARSPYWRVVFFQKSIASEKSFAQLIF